LEDLASAYTKETGITVTLKSDVMGKIMNDIQTDTPAADVIVLPVNLMDSLEKDGGVKPGTRVALARVEIALAVRAGAPRPDISTVGKLRAVLLRAGAVLYTQPGPPRYSMEAGIIDLLLKRPEFVGVHAVPIANGSGVTALVRGDGDMAMQVVPEILPHKEIESAGPLPAELGAHIDTATAVSGRSGNPAEALAFIRYITRPEATTIWKTTGVDRF
jgi:molybdate transport system substrate-binding protein